MKVKFDRTENRTAYITVEPEPADLEKYLEKVYKRMAKKANIPDYLEENAPHDVLEKHIDREQALGDAIRELAYEDSSGIIKDLNIENWLQPMITILQFEPPKYEIAAALRPIVEIADYRSLRVEPEPLEVTDAEVDAILEKNRVQIGTLIPVERPVKSGDLLIIDIEGKVSGKPFLSKKNSKFYVDENFVPEMPGLSEKLVGAVKEEEFSFKLTLPGDYSDKLLAGREADFSVKVHDVRELLLDEINDDFARKVAPGVTSLEELKKRIRYNMMKEKEINADTKFKEKIVAELISKSHLEYPTMMIDLQAKQIMEDYKQQLKTSAKNEKEYQEQLNLITEEQLKKGSAELAKKRVLWTLVLDEVAKAEDITVSEEEVAAEVDEMTADIAEEIKQKEARRRLHSYERENVIDLIKVRKTVNRLAEIVTGKQQSEPAQ
ncbi:MAG: trigger factor [Dehalococcoidales bacterium]|nr:trigger factor [Dehalococcoidales bacterium]